MAIQKNIDYKGLKITNAYCKIIELNGNKDCIFYTIGVYSAQERSKDLSNVIKSFSYTFVPSQDENGIRWDKQAYENVKTQTDFIDAIDLLD